MELGLLSDEQPDDLLRMQSESRLRMGQALIRLEVLQPEELIDLLDEFERDQADHRLQPESVSEALGGHPIAASVLELLPKMLTRVAHMAVRVGQGADTSDLQPLDHCTSVIVRANPGLWIGLLGDRAFATHVAQRPRSSIPECSTKR